MSVLVVEDDLLINMYACEFLTEQGHSVCSAANADLAMAMLQNDDQINVLFTDIDMPGSMNGVGLARIVAEKWPTIRIIITSGKSRPQNIPENAVFLAKPYRLQLIGDLANRRA